MSNTHPRLTFDLEHDLRALSAMASHLTPYLYESEMYGQISNDLPKLTLGGILLRLYRLTGLEQLLDADQQSILHDARINFEAEVSKWAVHYEAKLQHELKARIDALTLFLKECPEDLQTCGVNYPVQAENRTMIEHLADESKEHDVLSDDTLVMLHQADQRLRQLFHDGDFISDDRLKQVYAHNRFWWLYGYISEERR
jgi:hypothetical protein